MTTTPELASAEASRIENAALADEGARVMEWTRPTLQAHSMRALALDPWS